MKHSTALLFFTFLLILVSYGAAQSVRASIETSEVYIGQPFEFRIIVEGSTDSSAPELPSIDGVATSYRGASTTMVSSFGLGSGSSSTKTVTHSWIFTPLQTGKIPIPSLEVEVNGEVFRTSSGIINVKEPEPIEGYHLLIESDKEEYWQGEPVYLTIKWLIGPAYKVSSPVFNLPFLNDGTFTAESQVPPAGNDVYKIEIAGKEVLVMQSAEIFKGQQFTTLSFQMKLMTEQTGLFTLGPVTLAFDQAERSNSLRSRFTTKVIPSEPLVISIRELPAQAPSGIILSRGELSVESSASPLKVHIGDPMTFNLIIKGALTPEKVVIPPLSDYQEMEAGFTIPERRSPGKVDGNSVSFSQTIRAKREDLREIPSIQIPYFNTVTGEIESADSPAIPIEVMETQIVTSSHLESTGYTRTSGGEPEELTRNNEGLLHNFPKEKLLRRESRASGVLPILLLLLPAAFYFSLILFKKRNIFRLSGNNSFQSLYESLKESDSASLYCEINRFLHRLLDKNELNLTPVEIESHLVSRGNSRKLAGEVRKCLEQLEKAVFSREDGDSGFEILEKFYGLSKDIV